MKYVYPGGGPPRLIRNSLLALAAYILFSTSAIFYSIFDSHPTLQKPSIAAHRRVSKIDCSKRHGSCLIHNLYFIGNQMHIYLGRDYNLTREYPNLEDFRIVTGIGWGAHLIRFQVDRPVVSTRVSPMNNKTISAATSYPVRKDNALLLVIFTHLENPPALLPLVTRIVLEPTSFFSVLWPNLFRTMYAGVGAWFTQMHYNVFFTEHHRLILLDPSPKPIAFVTLLSHISSFPVEWFTDISDSLFRVAVLGISRDVAVAEIGNEYHNEDRFYLRSKVFRMFCDRVKERMFSKPVLWLTLPSWNSYPRVTLILRDGHTRTIVNSAALVSALKRERINLSIHYFTHTPLNSQISVIDKTDILITMHGAALTHILYMRPGTHVVELFPYAFRKTVYQNLASIMDVKYLYWQNTHLSDATHSWPDIARGRLTTMPKEYIVRLPINFRNMDSKNYWRNQHTIVRLGEFLHVFHAALQSQSQAIPKVRYLMYMPWEQLNNQILGLKSACAMASLLGRTLVLPHFGYRPQLVLKYTPYKPTDFVWNSITRYFDATSLLSLPCQHISIENFRNLNQATSIGNVNFIDLGPTTNVNQLKEYYTHILHIPIDSIVPRKNVYFQLSGSDILSTYGGDESRVLAFGSLFMHYDFKLKQSYPLKHYHNYVLPPADPIYSMISTALSYSERLTSVAKLILKSHDTKQMVAIHLRRGDYSTKCGELEDQSRCMISDFQIATKLAKYTLTTLYVATNDVESSKESLASITPNATLFLEDLLGSPEDPNQFSKNIEFDIDLDDKTQPLPPSLRMDLDSNDLSILDQIICINAHSFVGNLYSSFTRHVVEQRQLLGRESAFF